MNLEKLIVCESAPNIALIKYWGKLDEDLILPLNGSISITLDRNVLSSQTSLQLRKPNDQVEPFKIRISSIENKNRKKEDFYGKSEQKEEKGDLLEESDLSGNKRFQRMLNKVRNDCLINDAFLYHLNVKSFNNFPTACGLASSASGFACLAHCLAKAFEYKGDISELARLGSGSACRSCFGGFVKWSAGTTSKESIATPLFPSDHWPEMNIVVLVLEEDRKSVSSTQGMRDSANTSELLKRRVELVEEKRLNQMEEYIRTKNFDKFAQLVIKDSNTFHAVCMDTYPPLFYLNDKSKKIIQFVHEFNGQDPNQSLKVAYSFDAGPNCFLFVLDKDLNNLIYSIYSIYFKNSITENEFMSHKLDYNKNAELRIDLNSVTSESKEKLDLVNQKFKNQEQGIIKYLIHSKVGKGPHVSVYSEGSLVYENSG